MDEESNAFDDVQRNREDEPTQMMGATQPSRNPLLSDTVMEAVCDACTSLIEFTSTPSFRVTKTSMFNC